MYINYIHIYIYILLCILFLMCFFFHFLFFFILLYSLWMSAVLSCAEVPILSWAGCQSGHALRARALLDFGISLILVESFLGKSKIQKFLATAAWLLAICWPDLLSDMQKTPRIQKIQKKTKKIQKILGKSKNPKISVHRDVASGHLLA